MTTTEILTGIKNWVLSKLNLKQDVINDLAAIRSGSQAGSTAVQPSDLSSYFNDASYDTSTHRINFYHGQNIVAYVDASPFIVDGMVDDVRIENGYLVIDFNTASGKQDISIPLTDIFNPNNYYNKTQTDGLLAQKQDVIQDLADIRSGASAGSMAVQPSDMESAIGEAKEEIVEDVEDNYAKKDGAYETLLAGSALNLQGQQVSQNNSMYRTTAGSEDVASGIAELVSVKGNTVVWNQLCNVNSRNIVISKGSAYPNTTPPIYIVLIIPTKSKKHIFYIKCKSNKDIQNYYFSSSLAQHRLGNNSFISKDTDYRNQYDTLRLYSSSALAEPIEDIITIISIDLTLIYGEGNEPSTPEEFEADYQRWFGKPLTYEPYDAGSLRPVLMNSIKTVGFNQYNPSNGLVKAIVGSQYQITGTYNSIWESDEKEVSFVSYTYGDTTESGLRYSNGNDRYICNFDIAAYSNTSTYSVGQFVIYDSSIYKCSTAITEAEEWDASKWTLVADISAMVTEGIFSAMNITPDSNGLFIPARMYVHVEGGSTDTCVHLTWSGTRNGEYEPYKEHVVPFDVTQLSGKLNGEGDSVVVFPEGMKRVNDVYDEIVVRDGKTLAIKRVDSRAYIDGDNDDTTVVTDGHSVTYVIATPQEYLLDDVALPLNLTVDDWGTEEVVNPVGEPDGTLTGSAPTLGIRYSVDVLERLEGFVSAKKAQSFTSTEKTQARSNIGAMVDTTIDNAPADGSANLISSGAVLTHGNALDVSVLNADTSTTPATLATYADLSAAIAAVPVANRTGGMSIKFVLSSDNKYVSYRYLLSSTATADFTNIANWQGVDAEPTIGSKNIVESGGVSACLEDINFEINGEKEITKPLVWSNGYVNSGGIIVTSSASMFCQPVEVKAGETIEYNTGSDYSCAVVRVNSLNPVRMGDDVGRDAVISYPAKKVGTTVKYTAEEDMYVVISCYKASNKISFFAYKPNSIIRQVIYDVSANNNGASFISLESLLSSPNLSTLVPEKVRTGGMSIRFKQTDNNYVQFRYMLPYGGNTTAENNKFKNPNNWQGVDDEPTEGSDNLIKSGGVYDTFLTNNPGVNITATSDEHIASTGAYINSQGGIVPYSGYFYTKPIFVKAGKEIKYNFTARSVCYLSKASGADDAGPYTPIHYGTINAGTENTYTPQLDEWIVFCGTTSDFRYISMETELGIIPELNVKIKKNTDDIETIDTRLDNLYQDTNVNLIDFDALLSGRSGITVENGVYSGTIYSFYNAVAPLDLSGEYILSFKAKMIDVSASGNGLTATIGHGEKPYQVIYVPLNTADWTQFLLISNGYPISGIGLSYASSSDSRISIKDMQLRNGVSLLPYVPYKSLHDDFARANIASNSTYIENLVNASHTIISKEECEKISSKYIELDGTFTTHSGYDTYIIDNDKFHVFAIDCITGARASGTYVIAFYSSKEISKEGFIKNYSILSSKNSNRHLFVIVPNGVKTIAITNDHDSLSIPIIKAYAANSSMVGKRVDIFSLNPSADYDQLIINAKSKLQNGADTSIAPPIGFMWFSDLHMDKQNLSRILDYANKYGLYVDSIISTGDTVNVWGDDYSWWSEFGAGGVLQTIGNHDVWTQTNDPEIVEGAYTGIWYLIKPTLCYERYIAPYASEWGIVQPSDAATLGKCYYYKDYTYTNGNTTTTTLRLVVMDCMHIGKYSDLVDGVSQQVEWFKSVLTDARANNIPVMVAYHWLVGKVDRITDCTFNSYDITPEGSAPQLVQAVESFTADGGEFVCWIGGHQHYDIVGTIANTSQLQIAIDCATCSGIYADSDRVRHTKTQDSFNYLAIDTREKLVKLVRVGNTSNRYMQSKQTFVYRYKSIDAQHQEGMILCR